MIVEGNEGARSKMILGFRALLVRVTLLGLAPVVGQARISFKRCPWTSVRRMSLEEKRKVLLV